MRTKYFFFPYILYSLFYILSCTNPNGPVVSAGKDTTLYILDTLQLHGKAASDKGTITMRRWDYDNDGIFDDSSETDTTILFIVPETTAASIVLVFEAQNSKGEKTQDTFTITVLQDRVMLTQKAYHTADSVLINMETYTYGADTNLTEKTILQPDSSKTYWESYEYQNSLLTKTIVCLPGNDTAHILINEYDANNRLTAIRSYRKDQTTLLSYDSLQYDVSGFLIKRSTYSPDGTLMYYSLFTYDADKIAKQTYYSNADIAGSYSTFDYFSKHIGREELFNKTGVLTGWYLYKYSLFHRL
jgi:hypothetical protein